jgi:hypothetical protein
MRRGLLVLALLLWSPLCLAQTTYTIFGNATPKTAADPDTNAVTLGVQFTSTQAGTISGIRFYRGHTNTFGTYTVGLYNGSGNRLASASHKGDTCTVPCWEQVSFTAPVSIAANTKYTAAYYTTNGRYADDQGGLLSNVSNPPLTALANGGVYSYGSGLRFPTNVWNSSNYWVDVLFSPTQQMQQVISSIGFTPKTISAGAPAGTTAGTASVVMSPMTPAFAGTLATPSTDPYFAMSGNNLVTAQSLGAGTYNTSIIATQSGISNSPFTKSVTITVQAAPTLSLVVNPSAPSVSGNAPIGSIVATMTATWSDGSTFTGTYGFTTPYGNDGGDFAVSGNQLVTNTSLANLVGTVQNVTVEATQ